MIAAVTAGWLIDERDGQLDERQASLVGELGEFLDDVELALVRGLAHVEAGAGPRGRGRGGGGVLAPPARQPAAAERAVAEDAHAVPARGRQHVGLDAAHQDRVRRLLGHEPFQAAVAGGPLRLDDLAGGVGRRADVADLALPDQVGQRAEGLLDVGVLARPVHLVQVDVVGVQAAQRVLDLADDPPAGAAPLVRVGPHRHEELRGQHDVVAAPGEGLADDPFRLALGVDVGGVDEVDAGIQGAVDDADGVGLVLVSPRAEHHRPQAQRADRDAGPAEHSVLHCHGGHASGMSKPMWLAGPSITGPP